MKEKTEYITPNQAHDLYTEKYGGINYYTIILWIRKYELGNKIGGRWKINKQKFIKFLDNGVYQTKKSKKFI